MPDEYHMRAKKVVEGLKSAMEGAATTHIEEEEIDNGWSIRAGIDGMDAEYSSLSVGLRCEVYHTGRFARVLYPVINFHGDVGNGGLDVSPKEWKEIRGSIDRKLGELRNYIDGLGESGFHTYENVERTRVRCRKIDLMTLLPNSE